MFVLLSGFIGLVGLASAFDLPRVRGIVEQMADTLSPGPPGQLLREAARQGANGGTTAMVVGVLAALFAGTLAMAQVERSANRLTGLSEDRPFGKRFGVAFVLALSAGVLLAAGGLALAGGRAVSEGIGWEGTALTVWTVARWPLGVAVAAVGKWAGGEWAVPGGLGIATAESDGTRASALAVVNSVGDVIRSDGSVVAGTTAPEPTYFPPLLPEAGPGQSTVLVVVAVQAALGKRAVRWLAARGSDGITQSVRPAHTRYDGDVAFALAVPHTTDAGPGDLDVLGHLATDAVAAAVRSAVA